MSSQNWLFNHKVDHEWLIIPLSWNHMTLSRRSGIMLGNAAFSILLAVFTCPASENQFNEVDFIEKMRGIES